MTGDDERAVIFRFVAVNHRDVVFTQNQGPR